MRRRETNRKSAAESNVKSSNVIDLEARRPAPPSVRERLSEAIAFKLDREQVRIGVSTSLISIVVLATFANSRLSSGSADLASVERGDRDIASVRAVPAAAAGPTELERKIARELAHGDVGAQASIARRPSSLDELALGFLEGKYSLRLERGKIQSVEFAGPSPGSSEPKFVDRVRFLEQARDLLPVQFDRLAKGPSDEPRIETYELMRDGTSSPLANVEFRMDEQGRLLSMKVRVPRLASN